jgi:hypothetical protein
MRRLLNTADNAPVFSQAEFKPTTLSILVEPEIGAYLRLRGNQRKARLLLSTKTIPRIGKVRAFIETKVETLTNQPYKLRYRLAKTDFNAFPPELLASDEDLQNAVERANAANCGIHLFVQVNPGVYPPTVSGAEVDSTVVSAGTTGTNVAVSADVGADARAAAAPAVQAMRAARIDPADSSGYTMISFYGFRHIEQPAEFATQLEALWRPFQALGRVSLSVVLSSA